MERIRKSAAGIDIGAKKIFIAIEGVEVVSFDTFTESFQEATQVSYGGDGFLLDHPL